MDSDVLFVSGLTLCLLTLTSMLSSYSDGHRPRFSVLLLLCGIGLCLYAHMTHPTGYTLAEAPLAVYRVIGKF